MSYEVLVDEITHSIEVIVDGYSPIWHQLRATDAMSEQNNRIIGETTTS